MDLTPEEIRVLGCLLEKEATTPDQYPLSTASLRAACNQATNRDPVVDYTEPQVDAAMLSLREQGLARTVHGAGHRVAKHRHVLADAWGLGPAERAVLAVLLLRGPQTVAELKSRIERYDGAPGEAAGVAAAVETLAEREEPLVHRLAKRPGEREARVAHLVGGQPPDAAAQVGGPTDLVTRRDRLADLEAAVAALTARVEDLEGRSGVQEARLAGLVHDLGD